MKPEHHHNSSEETLHSFTTIGAGIAWMSVRHRSSMRNRPFSHSYPKNLTLRIPCIDLSILSNMLYLGL